MTKTFRGRGWRAAALLALLPIVFAGFAIWKAARVRRESAADVDSASRLDFQEAVYHRPAPSGVEPLRTPAVFRDAAVFEGRIYIAGPAGLFAYNRNGVLERSWLCGLQLPPAGIAGLAAGQRELLLATGGEGLLAFDGAKFRQILPSAAKFRKLTAVLPLSTGRVLLGTQHGLLAFDGRRLSPFRAELKDAHITALAGDDSELWIGTLDAGVWREHAGELRQFKTELPDPQVLSIAIRGPVTYAGTPLGVAEFREGSHVRSLASGAFARAVSAGTQGVSIGTQDEGVIEAANEPHRVVSAGSFGAVEKLFEWGGVQFALAGQGLYQRDGGVWRRVIAPAEGLLTDRNIAALAADASGRLWTGYFDRGLDIVDPALDRVTHLENDHLFCINRIVTRGDQTAVATANGLVMFSSDAKPRQVLGRRDGLMADHVTDFAFLAGGWVAATPAGLTFSGSSGMRSLYVFHGLVNNHVYSLGVDGEKVAAGTLGGLSILEGDRVLASYTTANSSLKHNWITAVVRVGHDWFAGTYGAGVLRLDEQGHWNSFADLPDGLVVNPNALAADGDRIYAGTLDQGLYIFDRHSARWTRLVNGLPSMNVTALTEAGGYLYVGTDNGLVRIRLGALL